MNSIDRDFPDPVLGEMLAQDFLEKPYWWDAATPMEIHDQTVPPAGGTVDVAIIGAGITGAVAALKLARAGAKVAVLDMQAIGEGAARRNAGYIGRTLKRSVSWLEQKLGSGRGIAIYKELGDALNLVGQLVAEEDIECHHQICGRLILANSPAHLRVLVDELKDQRRRLGSDYEVLHKHELHREIASDRYFGGAIVPDLGAIHPGLYHQGLVQKAREAGVTFYPYTEVMRFAGGEGLKSVETSKGSLRARHVVVTTNGYTSQRLDWFAKRVIPFRGFIIATEVLEPDVIDKILPRRRTYLDTKMNIDFIRPAPDSSRILFGGMTGSNAPSATAMIPALHRRLTTILPDLGNVRISRAWLGQCAGTFNFMPSIGVHDGVHYAMGYNFAGIPLGTHFGAKIATRILKRNDTDSAFDTGNFPTLPLYRGSSWFVPLAMKYFDWQDRRLAGPFAKWMV